MAPAYGRGLAATGHIHCWPHRPSSWVAGKLSHRTVAGEPLKVAGFGYCTGATVNSLNALLQRVEADFGPVDALAAVVGKTDLVNDLGVDRGLPVKVIPNEMLSRAKTLTRSFYSERAKNTGSVAEAVALLAADGSGPQPSHRKRGKPVAGLLGPRQISNDRKATCAVAEGVDL